MITQGPFSLVFEVVQDCPFQCDICYRRYIPEEKSIGYEKRKRVIDFLKERGLKRLTISGGEALLLGDELFDLLKYIHQKQIHSCLNTTGYKLSQAQIMDLDLYLDQLLIPIRASDPVGCRKEFGDIDLAEELSVKSFDILKWVKETGILMTVSTAVHRENISNLLDLGEKIASVNANLVWIIEEYYAMGLRADKRSRFEINETELKELREQITQKFGNTFKGISFNEKASRSKAPDFLITPDSSLVTTSEHRIGEPQGNILEGIIPEEFKMRRPWDHYKKLCRDWGWGDL